ncbi:hypothetical protein ACIPJ2_05205 [Curtobacterium sp. NPDC090217]|uniref:hypothetical protein n=1 Tax=Curtobacterium sp. NPDC090217 TaxID=3363970 RepID=UPI00382FD4A9
MADKSREDWFIVFPFLERTSGRIIVAIARILRLNVNPQLVSSQNLLQLILDRESATQLLELVERATINDNDGTLRYLIQEELRDFLDLNDSH